MLRLLDDPAISGSWMDPGGRSDVRRLIRRIASLLYEDGKLKDRCRKV